MQRIDMVAVCPYYIAYTSRPKWHGVECEGPEINLGFDVRSFHRFETHEEARDYIEIFCCDMYLTCPFYKWVTEVNEKKEGGR